MRATRCCCCIPVYTGAMVLGTLSLIFNLIELVDYQEFRCYFNLILSPVFLLVLFRDTPLTRQIWFLAYLIYELGNISMDWDQSLQKADAGIRQACIELKDDGHSYKDMGVATVDGCVAHVEPYAFGFVYFFFALYVFLNLHFILVVYTFMQNAELPVEDGGCDDINGKIDESGPRVVIVDEEKQ